jgi:hypothetical protein
MQAVSNLTERLDGAPILATHQVLMESDGPTSPGAGTRVRIGGSRLRPHEDDFIPAHIDRLPLGEVPVDRQRLVLLGHVVGDRG